jgi:hypothetical protein
MLPRRSRRRRNEGKGMTRLKRRRMVRMGVVRRAD